MNLFSLLMRRRQARLALLPAAEASMEPWEKDLWTTVRTTRPEDAPHLPWGIRHFEEALDDIGMDDGA